jgi:signal transduction histidine kinase
MSASEPIYFLLVDDLEENLLALEALLKRDGLVLLKARSGHEALEYLLKHEVGLALVDVQMPGMDGFELAELMRGTERTRRVPIIFVTAGAADRQRRFRGYEAGAVDFLQKPIETDVLRSKTDVFFELARQRHEVGRLLEESRQAAEALRESDRRKDEFLATLAHELRNPLAPIRTSLQLLKLSPLGGPDAETAREIMDRQVAHMVRLVDDLLDISRVNSGKIDLKKRRVSVAEVVRSAVEASRPLLDAARHELLVKLPDEELILDADPTRISQVFSNLLNNAAKYTPEGGRVELVVEGRPEEVLVEVRDNGVGIPQEMLPKVFDIFTQVGKTVDRSQGGLGIGLSLVRKLVEMHDGAVSVASGGHGQGSVFSVKLPRCEDGPKQVLQGIPGGGTALTDSLRILIVDDNTDGARSLSRVLAISGNSVRTANDGIEALAIAGEFRPEIVLLDIGMPGMNGYEVAGMLRRMAIQPDPVLVALTGWGSEEDRRKATEAGFDHHLTKPVEMDTLKPILASVKPSSG